MKLILTMILFAVLCGSAWADPSCTIHGTAGASTTKVVSANDVSPGRVYIFIQNTGVTNAMNFSIGQAGGATTSDIYLGPGQSFTFPGLGVNAFTTPILPKGQIDVIQNGGSTTWAFCDF